MKNKKSKLAFSLIELSIVILIIGILVIGISKGSRIISQAKLKSAQVLTTSSPVNSISGLRIWVETTLAKSLDSIEAVDGSTITNWYNINPNQDIRMEPFTQSGSTLKPLYVASGINSLPIIRLDGINDYLLSTLSAPITSDQLEIFVVYRRTQYVANSTITDFYNNASPTDYTNNLSVLFPYDQGSASTPFRNNVALSSAPAVIDNMPYIISTSFNGTKSTLYYNGKVQNPGGTTSTGSFGIDRIAIGTRWEGSGFTVKYKGDLAELIVFDRALSITDRTAVTQYLSQKYAIKLM